MDNYSPENLAVLKKKRRFYLVFLLVSVTLFVAVMVLFLIFATYENKTAMTWGGAAVLVLLSFPVLFSAFRLHEFRDYVFQFLQIRKAEPLRKRMKVLSIGKRLTLSDSTEVTEIHVLEEEQERIYYLISMFEPALQENEEYEFSLVSEYIRGWRK